MTSFRDVQQIIPFIFRLLIFMSGVMFPLEGRLAGADVPSLFLLIVRLNPLVPILDMYRWVFLGDPVAFGDVAYAIAASGVMLAFGFWFFRSAELAVRACLMAGKLTLRVRDLRVDYEIYRRPSGGSSQAPRHPHRARAAASFTRSRASRSTPTRATPSGSSAPTAPVSRPCWPTVGWTVDSDVRAGARG